MVAETIIDRLVVAESEVINLLSLLDRMEELDEEGPDALAWAAEKESLRHLADETLPWLIRTVRRLAKTAAFLDRLDEAFRESEDDDGAS